MIGFAFLFFLLSGSVYADTDITGWIESEIRTFLQQRTVTTQENSIKVVFNSSSLDQEEIVKGPVKITCRKKGLILGKTVFTFTYTEMENRSFQVVADIIRYTRVPVLKNPVERNHIFQEDDLSVNFVEVSWRMNEKPVSIAEAVGKRAKRYIPQGRVLTDSMIEPVPVIKRGDKVNMKVENKNISLTIPVISQGKGSEGDIIKVRDTFSNKYYYAEIRNSSNVIFKSNKR
jgi:flagella basal body P-ring formation protein FlgA